jgi:hypothetical protein
MMVSAGRNSELMMPNRCICHLLDKSSTDTFRSQPAWKLGLSHIAASSIIILYSRLVVSAVISALRNDLVIVLDAAVCPSA